VGFATFSALHARMVARRATRPSIRCTSCRCSRPAFRADARVSRSPTRRRAGGGRRRRALRRHGLHLFGASDTAALGLNAGYALQWWILDWLSTRAVRWYDLGGEAREAGLRQFKKGLVGKRGAIVSTAGEFDRWTRVGGRLAADAIYRFRDLERKLRFGRVRHEPAEQAP
jgi:hypothetical protein